MFCVRRRILLRLHFLHPHPSTFFSFSFLLPLYYSLVGDVTSKAEEGFVDGVAIDRKWLMLGTIGAQTAAVLVFVDRR